MRRPRWLLLVLLALLLAMGGMEAWADAHHGSRDAIYHVQFTMVSGDPLQPAATGDTWSDPAHGLLRDRWVAGRASITDLVAGGRFYSSVTGGVPIVGSQAGSLAAQFHALAIGGYRALGALLLEHAAGPVTARLLAGHRALRFPSTMAPIDSYTFSTVIIWLDARTLVPLQWQFPVGSGPYTTVRYRRLQRGASITLPAGFFDPPHTGRSLWDRLSGWLHDHMHR
jgi:hypothetical protein